MKYVIGFGAVCVISGLVATFWLWWYAERSISLRTPSVPHADGNGIAQPLLAEEHGSSSGSAPQPKQDIHPAHAIEAQQDEAVTHSVASPPVFGAGTAVAAPGADEHQEEQREESSSSSNSRKSGPPAVETPAGETPLEGAQGQEASVNSPATLQPPEESKATLAEQEGQKEQESNGSNSNSNSNIVSSPVAKVGDNGGNEDPPAGDEGNGAGAGTEELGAPGEVASSGEQATAR